MRQGTGAVHYIWRRRICAIGRAARSRDIINPYSLFATPPSAACDSKRPRVCFAASLLNPLCPPRLLGLRGSYGGAVRVAADAAVISRGSDRVMEAAAAACISCTTRPPPPRPPLVLQQRPLPVLRACAGGLHLVTSISPGPPWLFRVLSICISLIFTHVSGDTLKPSLNEGPASLGVLPQHAFIDNERAGVKYSPGSKQKGIYVCNNAKHNKGFSFHFVLSKKNEIIHQ